MTMQLTAPITDQDEYTAQAEQDDAIATLDRLKASTKRYRSAERIESRQPQLYQLVCSLLAAGMAPNAIAEAAGMDPRTVLALRARADAQGIVPLFRESYLSRLRDLMTIGAEELLKRFEAGKVTALDLKLLFDQHELLLGNATVRIAQQEDPDVAQFRAQWQAQLAARIIDANQAPLPESVQWLPDARPGQG